MNGGASYDGQFKVMVVEYGNNEEYNTYANTAKASGKKVLL